MLSNEPLKLTGLFGHPIQHSRSPHMQNAAFRATGAPYVYTAFDVHPDKLAAAVESIRILGMRGVNVTIPHKVEIMQYLDRIAPEAELIGAVNTIVHENGQLIGHNTDGTGYVRSLLEETGIDLQDTQVLIIGAGGAARAVASALAMQGARQIYLTNRTQVKANAIIQRISAYGPAAFVKLDEIPERIKQVQLVINSTSIGMHPATTDIPLDPNLLRKDMVVSDLIYNPRETRFLQEAKRRGAMVHGGLGMFVYQGAEAFTLWTGLAAPVAIMRETVEALL